MYEMVTYYEDLTSMCKGQGLAMLTPVEPKNVIPRVAWKGV